MPFVSFFNENNGNGQLQHLLNCIMISNTVISKFEMTVFENHNTNSKDSNAPFEKRRASLITVGLLRGAQTPTRRRLYVLPVHFITSGNKV